MEELIVGGEYTYAHLLTLSHNKWWMVEHHDNDKHIIGETFLVYKPLEDPNIEDLPDVCDDAVLSFVMSGYTTQGIFRLIYKYTG